MPKMTLEDIDVKGKRVLVRVDFNVPINNGKIVSIKRLEAAIPTISYLIEQGGIVILISHLGRPDGKQIPELSLKPCISILSKLLKIKVAFLDKCTGDKVKNVVNNMVAGQVILLENLRFHKQEVQNNFLFAKELADLGDVYVNDAFGTIHRSHASTYGITNFIDICVMGFLVKKEISCISKILTDPSHLFVAVIGGSKISDKLNVINKLLPKVDLLLLGGAMAFTFIKAKGLEIGKSFFEADNIPVAKSLLKYFGHKIILPVDCLVTDSFNYIEKRIGNTKYVSIDSIEPGWYGIDIGKKTVLNFSSSLYSAKTIIWNGPLGVFEIWKATHGTLSVANAISKASKKGATSIVGGGDSSLAVEKAGVTEDIYHVSTGGGASLKFIGGEFLPGIAGLTDCF